MSASLAPAPLVSPDTQRTQPVSPSQQAAWNRLWAILLAPVPGDTPDPPPTDTATDPGEQPGSENGGR
jgi:hypothetical protein